MLGRILILGGNGNMGKRYQTIFSYLKHPYLVSDLGDKELESKIESSEGVLITTPTHCHIDHISLVAQYKKPILCEKPITKDVERLEIIEKLNVPIQMVMQYQHFDRRFLEGYTTYNYYKSGTDGLLWDCINLIGLARGSIKLENTSPVWSCQINGRTIGFKYMDLAYIQEIQAWLKEPRSDFSRIYSFHKKVKRLEEKYGEHCNSVHWHPSA